MTIPEPGDGARVVINTDTDTYPLTLFWRDDAEAARWEALDGEHWFDSEDSDPMGWDVVTRDAKQVFLVDSEPWAPLAQPDDPTRVAVRLIVQGVVQDVVFDRDEYEQAKADDKLDHLVDVYVSDMDGESVVVEADGTEIRPF